MENITHSPVSVKKEDTVVITQEKQLTFFDMLKEVVQYKKATKLEWGDRIIYFVELKDGILMLHKEDGYHQLIVSEADLVGTDWVIIE